MRLPIPRIVKTRKHMKHRIPGLLLAGLMMCSMINAVTVAAAEMPNPGQPAESSAALDTGKAEATESSASVSTAYAISIQYVKETGKYVDVVKDIYECILLPNVT